MRAINMEELQAKLEEAEQKAARLTSELGLIHHQTLEARLEFAELLEQVGRNNEAVDLLVVITREAAELYGEMHPKTLATIEACRHAANRTQRWGEAKAMRYKAEQIRDETFGMERAEALRFFLDRLLGDFLNRRPERAIELAEAHMDEARTVLGPKNYYFLEYLCNYGRSLTAVGRSQEAMDVFAMIYPDMMVNSYIHKHFGGLLLWSGREEEYEALRARVISSFHSRRHRYSAMTYNLEKIVVTATMRPLQCAELTAQLRELIEFCDALLDTPKNPSSINYPPWWSKTVLGIGYYRLGNHQLALQRFDEAEKLLEQDGAETKPGDWIHQMHLIYRPLILNAMGKREEARDLFMANMPSLVFWKDEKEPLKGDTAPDGLPLTAYLALRDALEMLDIEMPTVSP